MKVVSIPYRVQYNVTGMKTKPQWNLVSIPYRVQYNGKFDNNFKMTAIVSIPYRVQYNVFAARKDGNIRKKKSGFNSL